MKNDCGIIVVPDMKEDERPETSMRLITQAGQLSDDVILKALCELGDRPVSLADAIASTVADKIRRCGILNGGSLVLTITSMLLRNRDSFDGSTFVHLLTHLEESRTAIDRLGNGLKLGDRGTFAAARWVGTAKKITDSDQQYARNMAHIGYKAARAVAIRNRNLSLAKTTLETVDTLLTRFNEIVAVLTALPRPENTPAHVS